VYGVAVSLNVCIDTLNVCMGLQYLSVTHIYTDTQSHKCAQMVEFSGEYGNTWVFGTLVLRCLWIFGTLVLLYPWIFGLLGVRNPGTLGSSEPWCYGFMVFMVFCSAMGS
jgi:hypothetical protein